MKLISNLIFLFCLTNVANATELKKLEFTTIDCSSLQFAVDNVNEDIRNSEFLSEQERSFKFRLECEEENNDESYAWGLVVVPNTTATAVLDSNISEICQSFENKLPNSILEFDYSYNNLGYYASTVHPFVELMENMGIKFKYSYHGHLKIPSGVQVPGNGAGSREHTLERFNLPACE